MAKEDYLLKRFGRENPYNVPEGYFDNFTGKMMDRLPERTFDDLPARRVTLWDKVKPIVYLAAMFAGIALMFAVADDIMRGGKTDTPATNVAANSENMTVPAGDSDIDMAADYCNYVLNETEMDDYSMYLYMEDIVE